VHCNPELRERHRQLVESTVDSVSTPATMVLNPTYLAQRTRQCMLSSLPFFWSFALIVCPQLLIRRFY
jgi:hypothetical protein